MAKKKKAAITDDGLWNKVENTFYLTTENAPIRCGVAGHKSLAETMYDMHFEVEIGIVLSGKMLRQWEGYSRELGAGDVWMYNIWEPHGFRLLAVPCTALIVIIRPNFLASLNLGESASLDWFAPFRVPPQKRPCLSVAQKNDILALAARIRNLTCDQSISAEMARRLVVLEIILMLYKLSIPIHKDVFRPAPSIGSVQPALDLVFKCRRFVKTVEAAQACAMSKAKFRKLFRRLMCAPFAKFALGYRVKRAAAQASQCNDSLEKIAADWGFTDLAHMHRCFKIFLGCSPAKWREKRHKTETVC